MGHEEVEINASIQDEMTVQRDIISPVIQYWISPTGGNVSHK